jgi:tetratricopeptide (TPR) repeat protein
MREIRGSIRRARGNAEGALADHRRALELARSHNDELELGAALAACAATHADRGEFDEAQTVVEEFLSVIRATGDWRGIQPLWSFVDRLGVTQALLEVLDGNPPRRAIVWREATYQALGGDALGAADLVAKTGHLTLEANLRLLGAERLFALGRRGEGEAELRKALVFYRSVEADHAVAQIEAALTSAQRDSA